MLKNSLATAVALMVAGAVWAATLDGTAWKVKVIPDAQAKAQGERSFSDQLAFKDGKLTSTACTPYGFGASEYSLKEANVGANWSVDLKSDKEGTSHWEGTVTGVTG